MKELTNQISEQDLQIEELKQRLLDKDNVIKEHLQAIENAKNELRKQKEKNAKMDDENFKSKMAQLEQLEQMKGQLQQLEQSKMLEFQLRMAQSKIVELVDLNRKLEKHQVIYIARKYDRIDENLSRFINRYPERDRMKIMFLRESEGVYQFGSKRVYIKIE